jgi:hypothetical protein
MNQTTLSLVIQLLIAVESGGDRTALNPREQAVGVLQIRKILVDDVNRILVERKDPRHFSESDRWDPAKSIQMAEVYLSHYGTVARLGHEPTLRDYALLWCAGPNGPKQKQNESMTAYLAKVNRQAGRYEALAARLRAANNPKT